MKIINFLLFFILTTTSILWSWHSLHLNISKKNYLVQSSPTSIVLYTSDLNQELFKISPFDDYFYTNDTKRHFADSSQNVTLKTLPTDYIDQLQNLTSNQKRLSWKANTTLGNLIYNIEIGTDNSVIISRNIQQLYKQPNQVGLSIVICQSCYVTDQKNRIYINQDFLNSNMISFFASEGLTPTIISNQLLPEDITNLTIIDNNLNRKYSMPISNGQTLYYDQRWNLVELKTAVEPINSQVINLNQ